MYSEMVGFERAIAEAETENDEEDEAKEDKREIGACTEAGGKEETGADEKLAGSKRTELCSSSTSISLAEF
jgi:hypothetical protein